MLQRINKKFNSLWRPKHFGRLSSRGQVAIILILVTAIALIFYAVALNFGKVSQTKTLTTVTADTGASLMGSQMASYGQSVYKTTLGDSKKVCAWSGIFAAIISLIVAIIALVLAFVTGGLSLAAMSTLELLTVVAATAGVILSATALALQITYIQPGITDMWNKVAQENLSITDQFVEQGVRHGLQTLSTDQVKVPDVIDLDTDGIWGFDGRVPRDKVPRFSVYYTELSQGFSTPTNTDIEAFVNELEDFILEDPVNADTSPNWGLYDPWEDTCGTGSPHACCATPSSECNPCCVPDSITNPFGGGSVPVRPDCCDTGGPDECGVSTFCGTDSPYGAGYPFVYDRFLENEENLFFSFRELLGTDDEHVLFTKDPNNPNYAPQVALSPLNQEFRIHDTTGYYVNPPYTPTVPDVKRGVFPFFYKFAHWGVSLNAVNPLLNPDECHWCDIRDVVGCVACASDHPKEMPQLDLPHDVTDLDYNITYFVDGSTTPIPDPLRTPSWPPLAPDNVVPTSGIVAQDTACAQQAFTSGNPALGFWKPGGDRFCSASWPYFDNCPKHGGGVCSEPIPPELGGGSIPVSCNCSDAGAPSADNFPDDILDDLVYGLPEFVEWGQNLIEGYRLNPAVVSGEFEEWYQDAAMWIEPGTADSGAVRLTDCYVCNAEDGAVVAWNKEIQSMISRLEVFLDNGGSGYTGSDCQEVWCVPPGVSSCPDVPDEEKATFDTNSNGVQGDLEDVVECLNYNVEGYNYTRDEIYEITDNVIPSADLVAFNRCFYNCNAANCTFVSDGGVLPDVHSRDGVTPYIKPTTLIDPSFVSGDCAVTNWIPGNTWYDAIDQNRKVAAFHSTRVSKGNDYRFHQCGETCSTEFCYELPRSLIPSSDYDPDEFQNYFPPVAPNAGHFADAHAFRNCLDSCNEENCDFGTTLPLNNNAWSSPPTISYVNPGGLVNCTSWGAGNAWYDAMVQNIALASPPDDADLKAFLRCYDSCGAANCDFTTVLPVSRSSDGVPYIDPGVPIDAAVDCDASNWTVGSVSPWYAAIIQNIQIASQDYGTMCDVEDPDSFINKTRKSALEADNQIAKFSLRRGFLSSLLQDLNNNIAVLREGATRFQEFIDGPVKALIDARITMEAAPPPNAMPYHAIYGWQSEPPEGVDEGYWHVVRVDVRTPRRCDNACNVNQDPGIGDPEWPRVRTYTKNWGTKRCYELTNTEGVVKFRVTRFDEDDRKGNLTFPNGIPIWDFKFFHPARYDKNINIKALGASCASVTLSDPLGLPGGVTDIYKGAFIMNRLIPDGQPDANQSCWEAANNILKMGVTSERCAQYTFDDSSNGFSHKFVPCEAF